jgi:hypothetical protein
MAAVRRLLAVEKRVITHEVTGQPGWLIIHLSYSDGDEVYEVRSLEGLHTPRRFRLESEMDAWLRKAQRFVE